jgi:uncharacterized protein (DUF433 family)
LEQFPVNAAPGTYTPLEFLDGRITVHPDICNGHRTIRGKWITVETLLGFLSAGDSQEEILRQYSSLEAEDIDACLRFAAEHEAQSMTSDES